MPALTISPTDQAKVLQGVSAKYGIPMQALLGIYGQETGFGQNVSTSSAGAVGPFQFIPSTAAQYGYPRTNTPTLAQFQQQADAWGKFLVAGNPSKSASGWAPAMGGGYTEAQAESTIAHIPSALKDAAVGAVAAGGAASPGAATLDVPQNALSAAKKGATSVADLIGMVTSTSFWVRLGEALVGILALYLGLHALTGQSSSGGQQAAHIKKVFIPV